MEKKHLQSRTTFATLKEKKPSDSLHRETGDDLEGWGVGGGGALGGFTVQMSGKVKATSSDSLAFVSTHCCVH